MRREHVQHGGIAAIIVLAVADLVDTWIARVDGSSLDAATTAALIQQVWLACGG